VRDFLARTAAVALLALITSLAAFFAHRQNAIPEAATAPSPADSTTLAGADSETPVPVDSALATRGRTVYEALGCGRCHAVEGAGNPRSPIDGVGARRTPAEIRAWVTASREVRGELSRSVVRAKESFGELADEELEALVEYLSSLR